MPGRAWGGLRSDVIGLIMLALALKKVVQRHGRWQVKRNEETYKGG